MKNIQFVLLFTFGFLLMSCSRADEDFDVLTQEDISNIILVVTDDATGISIPYNYTANSTNNPLIKLTDGKTYTVSALFKNGNEDETESIISAKDEHFLIFNFQGAQIKLTRLDSENSTRSDGQKLGLLTKWEVQKAINSPGPKLELTLIHDANSVTETQNGNIFGTAEGGEKDAVATYDLTN